MSAQDSLCDFLWTVTQFKWNPAWNPGPHTYQVSAMIAPMELGVWNYSQLGQALHVGNDTITELVSGQCLAV